MSLKIDGTPTMLSNNPIFRAPAWRKNSSLALKLPTSPDLPHLPTIANRPSVGRRMGYSARLASNDDNHPRVAKVIGRGPYRNQFGTTYVALVQAKGLALQNIGFAKNIPRLATAAGYIVNHVTEKGAIFVTAEGSAGSTTTGHTGIILSDIDPDYVFVLEQNYQKGMETEGWLPRSSIIAIVHL